MKQRAKQRSVVPKIYSTSDALSVRDAGISDAMASYDDANFHVSVPANDAKSWNSLIGIVTIEALVHFGNWWGRY